MNKFLVFLGLFFLATDVFAKTDYAEVTVKATIEIAQVVKCENPVLNFGEIAVKSGNEASTVTLGSSSTTTTGDVVAVNNASSATCSDTDLNWENVADVPLTNANKKTITLTNIGIDSNSNVTGILNIPPQVEAGEYTGSFTVTSVK